MAYRCNSCLYKTDIKSNLIRHLKRKNNTCTMAIEDIPILSIKYDCTNKGCTATYRQIQGRLRHEKKCKFGINSRIIKVIDIESFTPERLTASEFQCKMKNGALGTLISYIQEQQFNELKPENMNVYVSNIKDKVARIYDGKRWKMVSCDEVAEDMLSKYDHSIEHLIRSIEESNNYSVYQNTIHKWRNQTDHEGFDVMVKKQIVLLLYNLRDITKRNIK